MMRRRQYAGAISIFDDEDEEGLQDWFDKYDINKKYVALFADLLFDMLTLTSPDSGMISNLSESELCAISSSLNRESKSVAGELQEVVDADSPMSEPPASPRSEVSAPLEVPESDDPLATSKPEGTPPRATPMLSKRQRPDDDPDELNLVDLSRPPSSQSINRRSQSLTRRASRSKSRTFSPHPSEHLNNTLDEVREVAESLVEEQIDTEMNVPMDEDREPSPDLILPSSSPVLEKQKSPPRTMVHTTVDIASIQPSLLIPTPTSPVADPAFSFDEAESEQSEETPAAITSADGQRHHHFNPAYTLPPLKSLPPDYLRKGKSVKQKKREKEREKVDGKIKDEWTPMGLTKWGATIRANPVWKKVSRATKCLSTRDWGVCGIIFIQRKVLRDV